MTSAKITISNFKKQIPVDIHATTSDTIFFQRLRYPNIHKKMQNWVIYIQVRDNSNNAVTIDNKWYDNMSIMPFEFTSSYKVNRWQDNGKLAIGSPTVIYIGKNIGKKNQTNVFQQALREALSLYNKQLTKVSTLTEKTIMEENTVEMTDIKLGVLVPSASAPVTIYPPMCAQVFSQQKKLNSSEIFWVQRKYDGVRVVITCDNTGNIVAYSRSRKTYNLPEFEVIRSVCIEYRRKNPNSRIYFDGEVYKHGMLLQEISGYIRSGKFAQAKLKFMIFDIFIETAGELTTDIFSYRIKKLNTFKLDTEFTEIVETYQCTADEINDKYKMFISEGYEGAMARIDAAYEPSFRAYHSANLLKIKPRLDGEYKLIGYTLGLRGKSKNAVILECAVSNLGFIFNVVPAMTIIGRIKLADEFKKNFNIYKNKMLAIVYDNLSKDLVPVRASTKSLEGCDDKLIFRELDGDYYCI